MAFKWKCCTCERPIIVPYESPQTMSRYCTAQCPDCFKESLKENKDEVTAVIDTTKDENNNDINMYYDMDGMIIECSLEQQ